MVFGGIPFSKRSIYILKSTKQRYTEHNIICFCINIHMLTICWPKQLYGYIPAFLIVVALISLVQFSLNYKQILLIQYISCNC